DPPGGLPGTPSGGGPVPPGGLGSPDPTNDGGGGPARIVEICRVSDGPGVPIDPGALVPPANAQLPTVVGVLPSGGEVAFTPAVIDVPQGPPPPCQHVVYTPPDNTTEWAAIRVKAFAQGPIKLIALCGITDAAKQAQADDQAMRNALANAARTFAPTLTGGKPTRHVSLDP